MTLVADIIRDAYRESNLLAIATEPTGAQTEEALRLLQRLISSSYGTEAGEQLDPIAIGQNNISRPQGFPWYNQTPDESDWFVACDSQLMLNLESPQTVYLDPVPTDGARFAFNDLSGNLSTNPLTVIANGRTIEGATQTTYNTDGDSRVFMYQEATGNWYLISPIDTFDIFPFPNEFEDVFVTGLAFRLNPRYQQQSDPLTLEAYKRNLTMFKARYRQHVEMPSELGLRRTLGVGRRWLGLDTTYANARFNSGWPYPYGRGY